MRFATAITTRGLKLALLCALVWPPILFCAEETPQPAAATVPSARGTPRATVLTFVHALADAKGQGADRSAKPARVDDAVKCLDLSRIDPLIRKEKGIEFAWTLLEVIDRTWRIDPAQIAIQPEETIFRRLLVRDGVEYGEIVVARQNDGTWLFDGAFVAALPELWSRVRHLPRLEGMTGAAGRAPALWLQEQIPAHLKRKAFLLEHWQWLGLLLLIGLGVLIERSVGAIIDVYIRRWVEKRGLKVDAEKAQQAERPLGLVAMGAVWWIGLQWLALPAQVDAMLLTAAKFFAAACGVWSAYRLVDLLCAHLGQLATRTESKMDDLLVPLVRKTLKVFVVVFGLVFIADSMGLPVTTMLAGLGIGGVAIALAAKDTVENVFGSLTVLLDRPFQIGDFVKINDVEGTVEEVGFRSTRIRTFYNSLVTMPNSKLVAASVDNFGARDRCRVRCMLSITYSTPPDKIEAFCAGVRELLKQHPLTDKSTLRVRFNEFAGSSLDILLNFFLITKDYDVELTERERIFLDIIRLADRLGVEFAFPTQTLHIDSVAAAAAKSPSPRRDIDQARDGGEMVRIGLKEADELARKYKVLIEPSVIKPDSISTPPGVTGT